MLDGATGHSRDGSFAWSDTLDVRSISALLGVGARVDDRVWRAAVASFRPKADFVVLYTSGSTRAPKGVVLGRGAVTQNAAAIAVRMGFAPGQRLDSYFPRFFSGGLCKPCPDASPSAGSWSPRRSSPRPRPPS